MKYGDGQIMACALAALAIALGGCETHKPGVLLESPAPVTTTSDVKMFPEQWRREPFSPSGKALAESQMGRARKVMRRALAKYPERVITENLKAVYVLSELRYSGIAAGGTNSRTDVYVNAGAEKRPHTDAQVEMIFHAEFSSILLRNFARLFDEAAWEKCNPEGFTYLGSGVDAIKQKKLGKMLDESLLEQGFLGEYERSSLENDFNGYAGGLWCGDVEVWKAAEKYPRVKRKVELTIALYEKIDAKMNERFFRKLVRVPSNEY